VLDLMAALKKMQPATHRIGERVELWVPKDAPFVRGTEGGREGGDRQHVCQRFSKPIKGCRGLFSFLKAGKAAEVKRADDASQD